ncbi:MAG: hypothetical protein ACOC42_02005 [Halobacteriota archaeon]
MTGNSPDRSRRSTPWRLLVVFAPPILALAGIVALVLVEPGYPTDVAVGVSLFLVVWFWFRSLGRHVRGG